MYRYNCIIKKIVDGDTVDVDIDLGFGVWLSNKRIRFIGIDAPETRTRDLEEKSQGLETKARVAKLLPLESKQVLVSEQYEGKYGRILGDFILNDEVLLTELLLEEGLAEVYQ
jgi:micrococcal nuclease